MTLKKVAFLQKIKQLNLKIPSADIIRSYEDVTQTSDYFRYYDFHPKVFERLFAIGYQKFFSDESYDDEYLFDIIRIHYDKHPKAYALPEDLLEGIIPFYKGAMLSDNPNAKTCAASLLKDQALPDDFVRWLIGNYNLSEGITTTILRYPIRHSGIEEWVNQNFEEEALRSMRSELIAIKLNQDESFQIDSRIIINDIEYCVQEDINGFKKHIKEKINHQDYPRLSGEIYDRSTIMEQINEVYYFIEENDLQDLLTEFPYCYKHHELYEAETIVELPMWEIMPKVLFDHKHELSRKMIYGIYYSKLPLPTKESLIKFYVTEKTMHLVDEIAFNLKSINLLDWLIEGIYQFYPTMRFKKKAKNN